MSLMLPMASSFRRAAVHHRHHVDALNLGWQFQFSTVLKSRWAAFGSDALWLRKDNCTKVVLKRAPVIIVGAGPVGLTLSILLTKLGIRTILLDKKHKLPDHPQAHFLNNRTMEIFRRLDGLEHEIEVQQPPVEHWRRFVYCTTLAGPALGFVDHLQPDDLAKCRSPTTIAHFSQHRLLRLLWKQAIDLGIAVHGVPKVPPKCPSSQSTSAGEIYMGQQLKSLHPNSDGVTAKFLSPESKVETVLQCSYLVAADGAGSIVRNSMQVGLEGEADIQKLINVHFISKRLGQHLISSNPGMLYFVFNPLAIAVIVAHDLQSGEFVAQIPFYPPQQKFEDFSFQVCQRIISDVAGLKEMDIEVKAVKQWVMHAQVAEKFICGNGHVILVGDAAHRFPPAGGFGMNTGIQDAHNLAWKISLILKGHASPSLLDTYEEERKPIAVANTKLSMANYKAAMAIPSALGLGPSIARLVHNAVNSGVGTMLPKTVQEAVLNGLFAVGRAQVSESFLSRYNPIAVARLSRVQSILQQGDSLQLQFPAEDLGFRYTRGAIMPEGAWEDGSNEEPTGRRREYVPSSKPGVRLPHLMLTILDKKFRRLDKRISTLDLVDGSIAEFLLIVSYCKSGYYWASTAIQLAEVFQMPLKVIVIWPSSSRSQADDKLIVNIHEGMKEPWVSSDFDEGKDMHTFWGDFKGSVVHAQELDVSWWDLCGLHSYGALLVRPDDHIAWRSQREFNSDSLEELKSVFAKILHRQDYCSSSPQVFELLLDNEA